MLPLWSSPSPSSAWALRCPEAFLAPGRGAKSQVDRQSSLTAWPGGCPVKASKTALVGEETLVGGCVPPPETLGALGSSPSNETTAGGSLLQELIDETMPGAELYTL